MKRNMSNLDRAIRLAISALFAYLYFGHVVTGTLGIVLLAAAVIFTATAIVAWCPIYAALKLHTTKN